VRCLLITVIEQMGFRPYATNCFVHKFKEAGGCEAEMMFVRDGFDAGLVRRFCMSQKPHSCGPGAWSLPADRRSWDEATHAWAAEQAKGWPEPFLPGTTTLVNPYEPRPRGRGRGSLRARAARAARGLGKR
jgi:hypothetical protein